MTLPLNKSRTRTHPTITTPLASRRRVNRGRPAPDGVLRTVPLVVDAGPVRPRRAVARAFVPRWTRGTSCRGREKGIQRGEGRRSFCCCCQLGLGLVLPRRRRRCQIPRTTTSNDGIGSSPPRHTPATMMSYLVIFFRIVSFCFVERGRRIPAPRCVRPRRPPFERTRRVH
jgi:hypothetical protein